MGPISLEVAIRQLEAAEANLLKLERLWKELSSLIPDGIVFGSDPVYEQKQLEFEDILKNLPAINGWKPKGDLPDLNDLAQQRLDASEIGEISAAMDVERWVERPGQEVAEYRFRFNRKRRDLVRQAMFDQIDRVDLVLRGLAEAAKRRRRQSRIHDEKWEELKNLIAQVDTLLGSTKRPERWAQLQRHLSFGQVRILGTL